MRILFPNLPQGPLKLWAFLRLLTIVVAALAFAYHRPPPERLEEQTPIPDRMAERMFIAPWYSHDAVWYVKIYQQGYRAEDGTANFHPLYPLWALQLVSSAAGALLVVAFWRLARLDLSEEKARAATLLLLCWPVTLVIFAPYTEALWLLLAVLCFYYGRRGRWWIAGALGGLASLTRQQGLFLVVPLAWEMWEAAGRDWRRLLSCWKDWAALALVPLGYVSWVVARALLVRDFEPRFGSLHDFIYSVMISPDSGKVVKGQAFLLPWEAMGRAASHLWNGGHASAWLDVLLGAAFLFMLAVGWGRVRASYRIFSVIIALVSLSYYTGEESPYMGLPRHLLLAFPVFIGFASMYEFKKPLLLGTAGVACQALLICAYVWRSWVL
jgi:4-amino-4-deoxy-L-arabinose transferase-like glycosyltransferase